MRRLAKQWIAFGANTGLIARIDSTLTGIAR